MEKELFDVLKTLVCMYVRKHVGTGKPPRYETYLVYERHVSELCRCANVKMREKTKYK